MSATYRFGAALLAMIALPPVSAQHAAGVRFEVVLAAGLRPEPITGRVFVFLSHDSNPEPRLQAGGVVSVPFFGADVDQLRPGAVALVDRRALGYPLRSIDSLPPGDYFVQALASPYTRFARADGHTIWAHMDEWEGQEFNTAPGSLVSAVRRVHVDGRRGTRVRLELTRILPPVEVPPDDRYVKRLRIQSPILTKWWGHPMYLGAVVLLPRGYDDHPTVRYPAIWLQGHFTLEPPFDFTLDSTPEPEDARRARLQRTDHRESGREFAHAWLSDSFPRMVAIRILHPTPYYDDSYAVNSANNGPYGDAIMQELIPYLEKQFRVIGEPYARVLTGGSTGGWEALALQVYHPDFFGGTWSYYPDPVDFRRYELVNLYADTNAFVVERNRWIRVERPSERRPDGQPVVTIRQENQLNNARGGRRRGGENFAIWEATYGPTDQDGYPAAIWNDATGTINREVARYWRSHDFDIRDYLERNWQTIGPSLVGKIHLLCGDMDNYYLNLAVYLLEDFLEHRTTPAYGGYFKYGRPMKGHGWQPTSNADLVREMAEHVSARAPAGEPSGAWRY
ncbi:MAG TPA: alpha/beta hydrolase-fold protein [Gemmatimonadales bacterium]|nr:alpha/beta hydrolase-fold protein [Gemmatimonadales bacterium]